MAGVGSMNHPRWKPSAMLSKKISFHQRSNRWSGRHHKDPEILASFVFVECIKLRSTVGSGPIATRQRLAGPSIALSNIEISKKSPNITKSKPAKVSPSKDGGWEWLRKRNEVRKTDRQGSYPWKRHQGKHGTRVPDRAGDYINASDLSTIRSFKL